MTVISWHRQRMLCMVAILCCAGLIAAVIWSSDRGLELTDEAYYLLSAIHPEQVQLYISAQHWVLAPLWAITESLQGFRLTGAALLLGAAVLLALGATRCLALLTGTLPAVFTYLGVAAAGGVGALLYVVTIAPSPSYNLLASAGAYGAAGCALLAVDQRRKVACGALCAGAGGVACPVPVEQAFFWYLCRTNCAGVGPVPAIGPEEMGDDRVRGARRVWHPGLVRSDPTFGAGSV